MKKSVDMSIWLRHWNLLDLAMSKSRGISHFEYHRYAPLYSLSHFLSDDLIDRNCDNLLAYRKSLFSPLAIEKLNSSLPLVVLTWIFGVQKSV